MYEAQGLYMNTQENIGISQRSTHLIIIILLKYMNAMELFLLMVLKLPTLYSTSTMSATLYIPYIIMRSVRH